MTQNIERVFVVGDTFAGTAAQFDNVMTETDALEQALSDVDLDHTRVFLVQQGVDFHSLNSAVNSRNMANPGRATYSVEASRCDARATKRLAHKSRSENILISRPRKTSESLFEMDLCFSSQNEFFLDHMTGMHIQGIALIEAARQAFLAVTEAYFLAGDPADYYFVIKSMDTSFTNFVFPFDATLRYEITNMTSKEKRLGVEATITVIQAGVVCTTVKVGFTAFEAGKIATREREVAQTCLEALGRTYQTKLPLEIVA